MVFFEFSDQNSKTDDSDQLSKVQSDAVMEPEKKLGSVSTSSSVKGFDVNGGIDLNVIEVDRQGAGVNIQFDPVEIQEIIDAGITGFAPEIINITPLPSVLPLLGLAPHRDEGSEVFSLN